MLLDGMRIDEVVLLVDEHLMRFSLAGEGTKVNVHPLGT